MKQIERLLLKLICLAVIALCTGCQKQEAPDPAAASAPVASPSAPAPIAGATALLKHVDQLTPEEMEKLQALIRHKMFSMLAEGNTTPIGNKCPRFEIPFIPLDKTRCFSIEHKIHISPGMPLGDGYDLSATTYFSPKGEYWGSESRIKSDKLVSAPVKTLLEHAFNTGKIYKKDRKDIEYGEQAMKINCLCKESTKVDINNIWKQVAQHINVSEIEEFNMYCVNKILYYWAKNREPMSKDVILINIYGPKNPLGADSGDRPYIPTIDDKVRFIYDPEEKKIIEESSEL